MTASAPDPEAPPLSGLRVIEFGWLLACPYVGTLLTGLPAPRRAEPLRRSRLWGEVDERLGRHPEEPVLDKAFASAF